MQVTEQQLLPSLPVEVILHIISYRPEVFLGASREFTHEAQLAIDRILQNVQVFDMPNYNAIDIYIRVHAKYNSIQAALSSQYAKKRVMMTGSYETTRSIICKVSRRMQLMQVTYLIFRSVVTQNYFAFIRDTGTFTVEVELFTKWADMYVTKNKLLGVIRQGENTRRFCIESRDSQANNMCKKRHDVIQGIDVDGNPGLREYVKLITPHWNNLLPHVRGTNIIKYIADIMKKYNP